MYILDTETANKSAKVFEVVKSSLEQHFGGKILSTEKYDQNTDSIEKWLDVDCAVDAIVRTSDGILFGIAHRVTYKNSYEFTIRLHRPNSKYTEIDHLRQPGFKPRFHVQTVCKNGEPKLIAIAKTSDLVDAIDHNLHEVRHNDGVEYAALDWNDLIDDGYNVNIIKL